MPLSYPPRLADGRGTPTIAAVASDTVLDKAYQWLCKARLKYSPNSDVWDLRFHWDQQKPIIQQQLLAGTYTLGSMIRHEIDGEIKTFWGAADALVLKAIALVLGDEVAPHLSEHCWHLKGRGLKAAVSKTQSEISEYKFVIRSDIDSYVRHEAVSRSCLPP
jgi:RNA-directed DNA polymerase